MNKRELRIALERVDPLSHNSFDDLLDELYDELQAAQAPASGEVEPVAMQYWWPESPRIKRIAPFDPSLEKQGAIVKPLVYADTHPPAKVPEGVESLVREAEEACQDDGNQTMRESALAQKWLNSLNAAIALLTTPTPATTPETEWVKPTGRKHHDLKTDPSVFRQSLNGVKAWEIRRDDRDFVRGDTVTLHETENTGEEMAEGAPLVYTGRKITGVIGFVLNGPAYGLKPDWCVFSLLTTPPQEQ